MDYTKIDRPLEPHSCDEDAEQWVAVLAWEESRADALQAEVERLKGVVCAVAVMAHMAGQFDAGVDPSFSNAQEYANKITASNKG